MSEVLHNFYTTWVAETALSNLELALDLANPALLHLEFGVFNGSSIKHLAQHAPDRTFYGFDSFVGLPEEWDQGVRRWPKGHLTMEGAPPTDLPANVVLVPGLFQETLGPFLALHEVPVGFVHVDSDIYSSAKYVLSTLRERLAVGAIVVFDELVDWEGVSGGEFTYPTWARHEWQALREWGVRWVPVSRTRGYQGTVRYVGR